MLTQEIRPVWKERLLKLLRLRDKGVVFRPQPYDFLYVPDRHAVGMITEVKSPELFMVAFFPSLNNNESFLAPVPFNAKTTLVIPSFENLIAFGHQLMKRESWTSSHPDIVMTGNTPTSFWKHRLYGRISSRLKTAGDLPDYDILLELIAAMLNRGG